jgi:hypothetical protein
MGILAWFWQQGSRCLWLIPGLLFNFEANMIGRRVAFHKNGFLEDRVPANEQVASTGRA